MRSMVEGRARLIQTADPHPHAVRVSRRERHVSDTLAIGNAEQGVADHPHFSLITFGDAIDLVLHRTGIRVEEDGDEAHGAGLAE